MNSHSVPTILPLGGGRIRLLLLPATSVSFGGGRWGRKGKSANNLTATSIFEQRKGDTSRAWRSIQRGWILRSSGRSGKELWTQGGQLGASAAGNEGATITPQQVGRERAKDEKRTGLHGGGNPE